jgi:hypothetical protein
MNRLREEMKVIPRPAFALAVALGVVFLVALFAFQIVEFADSGLGFRFLFPVVIAAFALVCFCVFILLIGYIYGDARRRGMRPVLWALLAFFIPNAIGVILYFILREPLLVNCPRCGAGTKSTFPFCSACGESLARTCPSCRGAVESGWSHCPRCGTHLIVA